MKSSYRLTRHEAWQNLIEISFGHSLLLVWFLMVPQFLPLYFYIPFTIIISLIHQRWVSEWIHESAHINILFHKKTNDLFTDYFLGLLFLNDIRAHRISHFQHHREEHYLTSNDPDTNLLSVNSRREFRKAFILDLTGISALRMFAGRKKIADPNFQKSYLLYKFVFIHLCLFTLSVYFGRFDIYFIYYFSLVFLYPAINRVRVYCQHAEIHDGHVSLSKTSSSRTVKTGIIGRVFINSPLMKYHFEHHLYPQIPFRRLGHLNLANKDLPNQYALTHWGIIKKIYEGLPE